MNKIIIQGWTPSGEERNETFSFIAEQDRDRFDLEDHAICFESAGFVCNLKDLQLVLDFFLGAYKKEND